MNPALEKLLQQPGIWRGCEDARWVSTVSTGYPDLDALLPGGGWPLAALTEIVVERYGVGELRLLLPGLIGLLRQREGWMAWVSPPYTPYAPALAGAGIDLTRMLVVRPGDDTDALWAVEQALASGACVAVVAWVEAVSDRRLRRLQLAAETGGGWAVLFRPPGTLAQSSPAALRLKLVAQHRGCQLHVLKSRGGHPAVLDEF